MYNERFIKLVPTSQKIINLDFIFKKYEITKYILNLKFFFKKNLWYIDTIYYKFIMIDVITYILLFIFY